MLERYELIKRRKGDIAGAEAARVLREQFGDEPLINSENSELAENLSALKPQKKGC